MKKHPLLFKKLQLLNGLGANPGIHSNSDLARHIGVSRQAISRWCRGTVTTDGDKIPDYLLYKVAGLYGVEPFWFTLALDEFDNNVRKKLAEDKAGPVAETQSISISSMPITGIAAYGREQEIERLNAAWADSRVNTVQIVGFGGVGKSTLLNRWLSNLSMENFREARRVYAWSFYWQSQSSDLNTSGDIFIEHALQWFGDEHATKGSPWAKASRLAKLIRSHKTLLILDGLEPMQYPPGPRAGQVENPAVGSLIRDLAADNNGLCVITSRLPVSDLASFVDGRVMNLDLENLRTTASQELLSNLGLKGGKRDFESAVRAYDGHPLSLSLLGGFLSVVHGGDIHRFRELGSLISEKKLGGQARNLMRVYMEWFVDRYEAQILTLVGLFDRATALNQLQEVAKKQALEDLSDKLENLSQSDWLYGINLLESVNLLTCQTTNGESLIDCHPIVRDFIDAHLRDENPDSWRRGHGLIFEQLRDSAVAQPATMKELEPCFRAVIHGAQAGRYQEAFALYYDDIKQRQVSIFTEGSHHADQACIRSFFDREWDRPTRALSSADQSYLLSSAAANLIYLGQINDALEPSLKSIENFIALEKWQEAAATSGPLISMLIASGKLQEAISLLDDLEVIILQTRHPVIIAMAQNFRGYLLFLSGKNREASSYFEAAERVLTRSAPELPSPFPTISAYYCKFLLDTHSPQTALERLLKTFGWRQSKAWQVRNDTTSLFASDLIVLGLTLLETGDTINARVQLEKQIQLLRSADEWLYLPTGLNARARYFRKIENYEAARRDLDESIDISRRTGAAFSQWESYVDLAVLDFENGKFRESADHLQAAHELNGMEVYKFRNAEIQTLESKLQARL